MKYSKHFLLLQFYSRKERSDWNTPKIIVSDGLKKYFLRGL